MSGFLKFIDPGDPNMPGMLQVEALVQMSLLIVLTMPKMSGKTFVFSRFSNIKFFKKVLPGDKIKNLFQN